MCSYQIHYNTIHSHIETTCILINPDNQYSTVAFNTFSLYNNAITVSQRQNGLQEWALYVSRAHRRGNRSVESWV